MGCSKLVEFRWRKSHQIFLVFTRNSQTLKVDLDRTVDDISESFSVFILDPNFQYQLRPNRGPLISVKATQYFHKEIVVFSASSCSESRAKDRESWAVSAPFSKVCNSYLLSSALLFRFFNRIALKALSFTLNLYIFSDLDPLFRVFCVCRFGWCFCCES